MIKVLDNAYPLDLIFQKINHRKRHSKKKKSNKLEQNLNESQRKMLILPYIKNISEKINLSIDKNEYLN